MSEAGHERGGGASQATSPSAGGSGLRGKSPRRRLRLWLKARLAALEARVFGVVTDLTRVTNDGAYQSMRDAQKVSGEQPPVEGKRRGLPGG